MCIVDYYSDYFEIDKLYKVKIGVVVIGKLKKYFVIYGIFDIFYSDNRLFFNLNEFLVFVIMYEFEYVISLLEYS